MSRPVYVLRLRPERRVDPILALRAILKAMRWHGMQCVGVLEEATGNPPVLKDAEEERVADVVAHATEYRTTEER